MTDYTKHKQSIKRYNKLKRELATIGYKENEQRREEINRELEEIQSKWEEHIKEL